MQHTNLAWWLVLRQNLIAEPEQRRSHLRVIALQQAMGELKSTENGLRNHLAVLGRRHRSNEQLFLSPKPKPRD